MCAGAVTGPKEVVNPFPGGWSLVTAGVSVTVQWLPARPKPVSSAALLVLVSPMLVPDPKSCERTCPDGSSQGSYPDVRGLLCIQWDGFKRRVSISKCRSSRWPHAKPQFPGQPAKVRRQVPAAAAGLSRLLSSGPPQCLSSEPLRAPGCGASGARRDTEGTRAR